MARPRPRKRAAYAPRLVIMAKSPILGIAKRRLGREIGGTRAIRFYRACLSHTVLRLASARWQTLLAVTPDNDVAQHFWRSPRTSRVSQGDGDLGKRMQHLLHGWLLLHVPASWVMIVLMPLHAVMAVRYL